MFGRKKESQPAASSPASAAAYIVMPDIFYGGRDPELYRRQPTAQARGAGDVSRSTPAAPVGPPRLWLVPRRIWIIGGSLFVAAVAGISWYYLRGSRPTAAPGPIAGQPKVVEPAAKVSETAPAPSTTTENTAAPAASPAPFSPPVPPSLRPTVLTFPRFGLSATADLDADSLTDAEEEVLQTDSGVWDTDGDGYPDGLEVVNLYSPRGVSPIKLIDSGLVQEYVNPTWQYRVYEPSDWAVGAVDPAANEVLWSAANGDFIAIRAFTKEVGETFPHWLARVLPAEAFSDLTPFTNRFQTPGWMRRDRVVAYIPTDTAVFVLQYGARDNQTELLYPHILEMMMESFRSNGAPVDLPEQRPLPPTL